MFHTFAALDSLGEPSFKAKKEQENEAHLLPLPRQFEIQLEPVPGVQ